MAIAGYVLPITNSPTNGADQVYTVALDADGGTWTLTAASETTDPLAFDAGAAAVQAALCDALSVDDACTVTGAGTAETPFEVTFGGRYAGLPVVMTGSAASLTLTEDTATITVTETTPGVKGSYRGVGLCTILYKQSSGIAYTNCGTSNTPVWAETEEA